MNMIDDPDMAATGRQNHSETLLSADKLTLDVVMQALGDPIRLEIIRQLAREGECRCSDFKLPISKSTLSHHFKVLRQAGIIATRQEGTARISHLCVEQLEARFPGLLPIVLRELISVN